MIHRLMPRHAALTAVLLATALVACGPGDAKRSVDARSEVIEFFATDAPGFAILRPDPAQDVFALDRAADDVFLWSDARVAVILPLYSAGLGRDRLTKLVAADDGIEEFESAALAIGAPTPAAYGAGSFLAVLATDEEDLLSEFLAKSAAAGRLRETGDLHDATLYRSRVAAYAERDGVLIWAPTMEEVRAAIGRRDGDSDEQLDPGVLEDHFEDLGSEGPLLVYANPAQLRGDDRVEELLGGRASFESAKTAVATASGSGGSVQVEMVIRVDPDIEPTRQDALGVTARLPDIGSIRGVGAVSEEEIRLRFRF
jgi:hypothetical protein